MTFYQLINGNVIPLENIFCRRAGLPGRIVASVWDAPDKSNFMLHKVKTDEAIFRCFCKLKGIRTSGDGDRDKSMRRYFVAFEMMHGHAGKLQFVI